MKCPFLDFTNIFNHSGYNTKKYYKASSKTIDYTENNNDDTLLISLGDCCQLALFIKYHGYRNASFPFDWNFFDVKGLSKILKNDFRLFLSEEVLFRVDEKYSLNFYLNPLVDAFSCCAHNIFYNIINKIT